MNGARLWIQLGASCLLGLLAPLALAQSSAELEGPVPSAEAPTFPGSWIRADRTEMVTIITREQIEAQRTASVTEVLRMIPGLHIVESGARGGVTSLHMRGGEANYTAVLIDGVQVNDPTNARGGSFDFALLGTENIERIEIMHGPLSAGLPSSAISGAINIVTRRGETDGRSIVDVSAGNDGYYRGLLETNGRDGRLDYSLSLSLVDIGDPMPGSEFKREALAASIGYELSDRVRLRGHFRFSDIDRDAYADASGGPRFAPAREVETHDTQFTLAGIGIEYDPTSWWRSRLDLAVFDQDEDLATPPLIDPRGINTNLPPTTSDTEFTRNEITWRNDLALSDRVSLIAGAETSFERGSSDGLIDFFGFALIPTHFSLNRDVLAPFVEVETVPLPGLRLRAGLRYEMPRQAENELTPHVGLLYASDSLDTDFRANWGRGFKLPSFFALAHPLVGDPALDPETSQTFDVGATTYFWDRRASMDAAYFYNEFYDLIDFDPIASRLVNRSTVVSWGFEGGASVQPHPTLAMRSYVTLVKTDIKGTSEELRNRPEWRGGASLRWEPSDRLEVMLNALFVGTVRDFAVPVGETKLDPYARVDLAVSWKIDSKIETYLAIENLFDESYEEVVGFPAQGFSARIGLRFER